MHASLCVRAAKHPLPARPPAPTASTLPHPHPAPAPTGPSFAKEVMNCRPTGIVAASKDKALARSVQRLFASPSMRVNTSSGAPAACCSLAALPCPACRTLRAERPCGWLPCLRPACTAFFPTAC